MKKLFVIAFAACVAFSFTSIVSLVIENGFPAMPVPMFFFCCTRQKLLRKRS